MKPIKTSNAPEAIGPYSQAVDSGAGLVFLSGQLPIDPATGAFPEGGVKEQTRQSLLNVAAILREAGFSSVRIHNRRYGELQTIPSVLSSTASARGASYTTFFLTSIIIGCFVIYSKALSPLRMPV